MATHWRHLWMDFLLFVTTFFWGTTFIIVKNAVVHINVYVFLGVRFGLAFLVMAVLFRNRIIPLHLPSALAGVILGLFLFAAFAFQTWGLTHTSATNGAFLTACIPKIDCWIMAAGSLNTEVRPPTLYHVAIAFYILLFQLI